MTTGKTRALTIQTFVGKVMSLFFNMLSRFAIAFLPRSVFYFMAAVTICSDFGAPQNKVSHCWPMYLPWSDGTRCHDLSFLNVKVFVLLFYFTILYWFCHTLTCILHGCTRVPHPEPPSLYHPSGSSQCTSPKHPVSCIKPGLAFSFLYDIIHASMPLSQIIPPSPSPTESKRLFYISVSLLLSHIQGYHHHLSKFHIYALVYCIGGIFSGLLHSV